MHNNVSPSSSPQKGANFLSNSSPKKSEKIIEQIQSLLKEDIKQQRSPQKRNANAAPIIKPSRLGGVSSSSSSNIAINKNGASKLCTEQELFKETTNTKSVPVALATTRAYPSRTRLLNTVNNADDNACHNKASCVI